MGNKKSKKTPKKQDINKDFLEKLKKASNNNKKPNRLLPFIVLIGISLIIAAFSKNYITTNQYKTENVPVSTIIQNYNDLKYKDILIDGNKLIAISAGEKITENGTEKTLKEIAILPEKYSLGDLGLNNPENKTPVSVKDKSGEKFWAEMLPTILTIILFGAVAVFLLSRMSGMSNNAMMFSKSRARLYGEKDKVTFKDVAGAEEEKYELQEFVDFLKHPKKYQKMGAKLPRGTLLVGPPGTGKTLLARAVAGESGVPFLSISGSEFVEMFVGVGASRVRDLFEKAKKIAPAIIFIDEIDAIGKKRGPGIGGGHDEREQTLNQILTEMDGFDNETNVIVMGATNRADVLDKALLRPGRFDRKVTINLPNLEDREKILEVHARNKKLDEDVNMKEIASATVGFSGADLENLFNESAILAARYNAKKINAKHIQEALEKKIMGLTKKSRKMNEKEKNIIAYHEVGHALVGKFSPNCDPVNKISIVSRGGALGVTWFLPERDSVLVSKAKFEDELASLYGGRVAEEIFFGKNEVTTGASNDIERATAIARNMITRYGMDDELGAENFAPDSINGNYLGAQGESKQFSEKTQELIDVRVKEVLSTAYNKAKEIITKNKDLHEKIVQDLLEKEEMTRKEFEAYFA
ncbi:MAG: ATP-dependent zinc metalloprotease FtsH [Candidatus Gracilibacteria bacterium]|nr:ATP-dependent zinc metalloprotease FtsH [Candidatus Gracilibacteria bacterium]